MKLVILWTRRTKALDVVLYIRALVNSLFISAKFSEAFDLPYDIRVIF